MSEALFTVDHDTPAENAPPVRVAEADMLALLRQRYTRIGQGGAHRYVYAQHVPDRVPWHQRTADFVAVDCHHPPYDMRGRYGNYHEVIGHEVKVSRSDWLTELGNPLKAAAFTPFCHRWYLVVPDEGIVRGDLPEAWGLLVVRRNKLVCAAPAPFQSAEPMPSDMSVAFMRAVAKTARRTAVPDPSSPTEQEQTP